MLKSKNHIVMDSVILSPTHFNEKGSTVLPSHSWPRAFGNEEGVFLQLEPGAQLNHALVEATELADFKNLVVIFLFEDKAIVVSPKSNLRELMMQHGPLPSPR